MLLLALISIIIIFIVLPINEREPFAYAIFITIVISGATSVYLNKLWGKIKPKDKNPLI